MSTDDDKPARPFKAPGEYIEEYIAWMNGPQAEERDKRLWSRQYLGVPTQDVVREQLRAAILGPLAESAPEGFARADVDAGRPTPPWDRDVLVLGAPDTRLDPDGDAELLDDLPREPRRYDPRSVRFVLDGQPVVMSQGGAVARAALDRLARDAMGLSRFPGRDSAIALNPSMEVQYVAVWSDPQPRREHPRRAFRRERRAIIREARARICPDAFELRVACLTAPERRGLQVRGFDVLRRALSAGRYRLGLVMGHLATLDPRRLP